MLCGVASLMVTRLLMKGYSKSLADNLASSELSHASFMEHEALAELASQNEVGALRKARLGRETTTSLKTTEACHHELKKHMDSLIQLMVGDAVALKSVLLEYEPLPSAWVPHLVVRLNDETRYVAKNALKRIAPRHIGALVDALLNDSLSLNSKQQLLEILESVPTKRCATMLMAVITMEPIELREGVARTFAAILHKNASIQFDKETILTLATDELGGLQKQFYFPNPNESELSFVNQTIGLHTSYVMHLLSTFLPVKTLSLAFEAMCSDDQKLRGTAKEYLESVLPASVRDAVSNVFDVPTIAKFIDVARQGNLNTVLLKSPSLTTLRNRLDTAGSRSVVS